MSHVKGLPHCLRKSESYVNIFQRLWPSNSWVADKIIETEPRRARKRDADGNARLVLKETTLAFGESQILVFAGKVMHCESQTMVSFSKS